MKMNYTRKYVLFKISCKIFGEREVNYAFVNMKRTFLLK